MKIRYPEGATPLDPNEVAGLIPHIRTQGDLNDWEYNGITAAKEWGRKSRKLKKDLLSISGLYTLHKRMFEEVWEWAGRQRNTMKNIGVEPGQIGPRLKQLCGNVQTWVENETYDLKETAVRFHHGLVKIHPFVNGNGRHARLAADLFLIHNGKNELSWGMKSPNKLNRKKYILALVKADRGDFGELIAFCLE